MDAAGGRGDGLGDWDQADEEEFLKESGQKREPSPELIRTPLKRGFFKSSTPPPKRPIGPPEREEKKPPPKDEEKKEPPPSEPAPEEKNKLFPEALNVLGTKL